MGVRVITDSTAYIPAVVLAELGIGVVSLGVVFAGGEAHRETEIEDGWFYERLAKSPTLPTSSQPSPAEIEALLAEAVEAADGVVGVFISSEMSGTFASAELMAAQVREAHAGAAIEIVDSRSNSMQLGMAVIAAARAARDGADVAACAQAARDTIPRTRYLFTPHTLENLRRGGRIGGAAALLGTILGIRPVLTVEGGRTEVFDKVRTKRRAMERIAAVFAEDVARCGLRDVVVHHIDDVAEGRELAALIEPVAGRPVELIAIGPVIGLHVGTGTVGVVYETERPLR